MWRCLIYGVLMSSPLAVVFALASAFVWEDHQWHYGDAVVLGLVWFLGMWFSAHTVWYGWHQDRERLTLELDILRGPAELLPIITQRLADAEAARGLLGSAQKASRN